MRRPSHYSVIAWALLLVQAVTSLSPATIVLCREDNGTSHFEVFAESCCDAGQDQPQRPTREPTLTNANDATCEGARCVDETVRAARLARGPSQPRPEIPLPPPPSGPRSVAFEHASPPVLSDPRPTGRLFSTTPPRESVRSRRATVLIL